MSVGDPVGQNKWVVSWDLLANEKRARRLGSLWPFGMAADWSMLQRGGDLVFKIFFLVSKNKFQPGFSRVKVCDAAFEPKFVKNFKTYKIA